MLKLNIGISNTSQTISAEVEKYHLAARYGVDYVSVISIEPKMAPLLWDAITKWRQHEDVSAHKPILCSVPLYEAQLYHAPILDIMKRHYEEYGVRAFTCHVTTRALMDHAKDVGFVVNSRAGEFLREAFDHGDVEENPNLTYFDEICRFCAEHGCELMLGTSLRPGLVDGKKMTPQKSLTYQELYDAVKLFDYARSHFGTGEAIGCQIETFGHVPAAEIPTYKDILEWRPVCAMGPLLTDCVNGFDDLNAMLGYALIRQAGINVKTTCMLSRKEHIDLPGIEDVEDECKKWRVVETVIGCAIGDDQRALTAEAEVMRKRGQQRKQCSAHVNIFGEMTGIPKTCTMCGPDHCPLRQ